MSFLEMVQMQIILTLSINPIKAHCPKVNIG